MDVCTNVCTCTCFIPTLSSRRRSETFAGGAPDGCTCLHTCRNACPVAESLLMVMLYSAKEDAPDDGFLSMRKDVVSMLVRGSHERCVLLRIVRWYQSRTHICLDGHACQTRYTRASLVVLRSLSIDLTFTAKQLCEQAWDPPRRESCTAHQARTTLHTTHAIRSSGRQSWCSKTSSAVRRRAKKKRREGV